MEDDPFLWLEEVEGDRVLATVMFTDIADSTRRAADLGDRSWRAFLDRHALPGRAQDGAA